VAFGALGTPILTLAQVTGLDEMQLSAMAGRQLPFFSILVPAWLVCTMAGWRATWEIWPAWLVCGGSFALVQFLMANFHGPRLWVVAGGVPSMLCLAGLLRFWQPRRTWHFPEETRMEDRESRIAQEPRIEDRGSEIENSTAGFVDPPSSILDPR